MANERYYIPILHTYIPITFIRIFIILYLLSLYTNLIISFRLEFIFSPKSEYLSTYVKPCSQSKVVVVVGIVVVVVVMMMVLLHNIC